MDGRLDKRINQTLISLIYIMPVLYSRGLWFDFRLNQVIALLMSSNRSIMASLHLQFCLKQSESCLRIVGAFNWGAKGNKLFQPPELLTSNHKFSDRFHARPGSPDRRFDEFLIE